MSEAFPGALALTLRFEGGYQNLRSDPGNRAPHGVGGGTNRGITQATYDAFRDARDLPYKPVRHIADEEVAAIYRTRYWALPSGPGIIAAAHKPILAACAFDWGVHGGTGKARRFVQAAVGVLPDGQWGPKTLDAIAKCDDASAAARLNVLRVAHHWVRCRGDEAAREALRAARIPELKGVWPQYSASAEVWLGGFLTRVRTLSVHHGLPVHPSFAPNAEDGTYPRG